MKYIAPLEGVWHFSLETKFIFIFFGREWEYIRARTHNSMRGAHTIVTHNTYVYICMKLTSSSESHSPSWCHYRACPQWVGGGGPRRHGRPWKTRHTGQIPFELPILERPLRTRVEPVDSICEEQFLQSVSELGLPVYSQERSGTRQLASAAQWHWFVWKHSFDPPSSLFQPPYCRE